LETLEPLELPERHGHLPPPPGEAQPLRPGRSRSRQAGGGAGFVTVNQRLFAPLQGLDPNNVLQGGYGWLSKTDGGATFHPGVDLNSGGSCNADNGAGVVAPLAGVVRATLFWNGTSMGEGNHVWVELDDPCLPGPTWWHTDHLLDIVVAEGQRLSPGEPIGLCGRTGGWDCAHAHTELLTGPPAQGYWQWPYAWSRAQVEAAYWNPSVWWQAATALVLAEGHQPIPPEAVTMLSDWEVLNWIMPDLWRWANVPYNPEALTSKAWLKELREGRYRGRPRTTDRGYGDGRGDWAEFDYGTVVTRKDSGEWSWQG
jgi:murein DD-endopeptidase MepM/ murein hydrolase activator NlpD